MITRKMALLGSNMGSMRSIHSAASSGGVSRVSASHRKKSQVSLYDKISRNLSWFDSDGGGARTRRSSRQRSAASAAVNEAFEHDEDRDLDSVIDIEPPSYLIERRR